MERDQRKLRNYGAEIFFPSISAVQCHILDYMTSA